MGFDVRTAILSGAYGLQRMNEANWKHRQEKEALDKNRWQTRMAEQQQGMQMAAQEHQQRFDVSRLENEWKKLAADQARHAHEVAKWKEQQKLETRRVETGEKSAESLAGSRESTEAYQKAQLEIAKKREARLEEQGKALADWRKNLNTGKVISSKEGLAKEYTRIFTEVFGQETRKYKWGEIPDEVYTRVREKVEEIMEPYYDNYTKMQTERTAIWATTGGTGQMPENPASLEEIRQASGTEDPAMIQGLMQSEDAEKAREWYSKSLEDPDFVDRAISGGLTAEEFEKLKFAHPENAQQYAEAFGEPAASADTLTEKIVTPDEEAEKRKEKSLDKEIERNLQRF